MSPSDRTQLSASASEALEVLRGPLREADGLSRGAAVERLVAGSFERPDARAIVDELLSKGYLYEVNDELHVTPA